MKITEVKEVKNEIKIQERIDWRKLDPGTVVEFVTGVKAVVMVDANDKDNPGLLLLTHGDDADTDYYETANGYKDTDVDRVIGKIKEIIVKEQLV